MGYSCTAKAHEALRRVMEVLQARGYGLRHDGRLLANGWKTSRGEHFYEIGREHLDGAMTGPVFRVLRNGRASRIGSFRIEPDGKIRRFPGLPREVLRALRREGY